MNSAQQIDTTLLQQAIGDHNWPYIAACLIYIAVRIAKLPMVGNYWDKVPKKYRPLIPVALGVLSGFGEALLSNRPWLPALLFGLVSGLLAIGADQATTKPLALQPLLKIAQPPPDESEKHE